MDKTCFVITYLCSLDLTPLRSQRFPTRVCLLGLTVNCFQLDETQLELQDDGQSCDEIQRPAQARRHPPSQFAAHLQHATDRTRAKVCAWNTKVWPNNVRQEKVDTRLVPNKRTPLSQDDLCAKRRCVTLLFRIKCWRWWVSVPRAALLSRAVGTPTYWCVTSTTILLRLLLMIVIKTM